MSFASAELLEEFSIMTAGPLPPFFAAAISAIAHPVTIYDGHGAIVAMSAASRALHRLSGEVELPCPFSQLSEIIELRRDGTLLPPSEWPLQRALAGEPTSGVELRVRRCDTGAEWTARYTATPVRDSAGEIVLIVETAEDLRDQKQIEKALLNSELRSRSIIEANIIGIVSCTLDGRITEANDEFLRIVGRRRGEVDSGNLRWDEMTPPKYLPKDQEAVAEARRQGFCRAYEKEYIHADGHHVPVLIGFALLGDSKANAVAFILDLTIEKGAEEALRRSEERYRSLIAATTSVVWSAGPSGEFTEPQPTWQAYTGQEWPEHRGFGWTRVLHPDDREQVLASWKHSVETRARFHSSGRMWHAPSSSYRYFEARGVPIFSADQQVREWIGTVVDTHENRLAQEAEHDARREAEAANRAKDEFLAVLSHELRTPLTPAFLSIDELMDMPNVPEAIRAELTVVRRNLGHETKLIDDLLDMTRIQSGKLELRFEFVDLHEVIRETAHDCLGDCRRKNIELHVELRATRSEVRGDVVRLRQIFWNLLRNAVKFTPAGGRIEIETSTTETGQMLACVRDNGIGFPAGMEARLFSRFEQGGSEVTRRFGGPRPRARYHEIVARSAWRHDLREQRRSRQRRGLLHPARNRRFDAESDADNRIAQAFCHRVCGFCSWRITTTRASLWLAC
jgi:PAS domain S-box-containing protein